MKLNQYISVSLVVGPTLTALITLITSGCQVSLNIHR